MIFLRLLDVLNELIQTDKEIRQPYCLLFKDFGESARVCVEKMASVLPSNALLIREAFEYL
jgi:hypothetical protein